MTRRKEYLLHSVLFFLTAATTLFAGAFIAGGNPLENPGDLRMGTGFSFTLMLILLLHELSHYFTAKKHGAYTSLPFFIPAPTLIGTFGAVIKMKSRITDKNALADIGASGPFASFLLSVGAAVAGLMNSEITSAAPEGGLQLGNSLIFSFLVKITVGEIPEGSTLMLSPVAFAAWIGFLVTSLNLIPAGQLDGGHIMYSVAGSRHPLIAKSVAAALVIMGIFWIGWLVWAALLLMMGLNHPPPADDITPVNRARKAAAGASLAVFVLTFVPVPLGAA